MDDSGGFNIGSIIGPILLISFLPTLLQALGGLGGGQQQQQQGPFGGGGYTTQGPMGTVVYHGPNGQVYVPPPAPGAVYQPGPFAYRGIAPAPPGAGPRAAPIYVR